MPRLFNTNRGRGYKISKLFIDVDDTLIIWDAVEEENGLYKINGYALNIGLIGQIGCFLEAHRDYELIVWSGGGVPYARDWADKCGLTQAVILDKDMLHPSGDDICVDDMYGELAPRDKRVRVFSPESFEHHCPLCPPEG